MGIFGRQFYGDTYKTTLRVIRRLGEGGGAEGAEGFVWNVNWCRQSHWRRNHLSIEIDRALSSCLQWIIRAVTLISMFVTLFFEYLVKYFVKYYWPFTTCQWPVIALSRLVSGPAEPVSGLSGHLELADNLEFASSCMVFNGLESSKTNHPAPKWGVHKTFDNFGISARFEVQGEPQRSLEKTWKRLKQLSTN